MGVTPPSSEAQPARVATTKPGEETAKPETRSKFEAALRRMHEDKASGQELAGGESLLPFEPLAVHLHALSGSEDRNGGDVAPGFSNAAAIKPSAVSAEGVAMSSNALDIAPSHREFQNRISLPAQGSGGETFLTMTDQRWIASHAILRQDEAGGLSVEIQTRSDADTEQQRQALRSRLEARGHRITSIDFDHG